MPLVCAADSVFVYDSNFDFLDKIDPDLYSIQTIFLQHA